MVPSPARPAGRSELTALVLAGGGARGAYEAGALAALAPALVERGEAPAIIVGTSIGALNGAFLAARAHQPLQATAAAAVEMWRELRWGDALRPLVSPSELARLLGAGALLAGLPGGGLTGLLDPAPVPDRARTPGGALPHQAGRAATRELHAGRFEGLGRAGIASATDPPRPGGRERCAVAGADHRAACGRGPGREPQWRAW